MVWHDWERAVGSTVVATITIANYGKWPRSLDDWVTVAVRHGLYLNIGPWGTYLLEHEDIRIAFIRATPNRRLLHNRVAHEVAEHLLTTECSAPFKYKGDRRCHHRVACYVQAYDRKIRQKRRNQSPRVVGSRTAVH